MTFPSRDPLRLPETSATPRFAERLARLPLPVLAGIGVVILVIVLVALFPGSPKLAAPFTGAQARPATADAVPGSGEPIQKPSPQIPKRARRNR